MASTRVFVRQVSGRLPVNVNLPDMNITRKSAITVTGGLVNLGNGFFDPNVRLLVHGPDVHITNVAPHDDEGGGAGIEFVVNVDSPTPVDVAVTLTVLEDFQSHVLV